MRLVERNSKNSIQSINSALKGDIDQVKTHFN